ADWQIPIRPIAIFIILTNVVFLPRLTIGGHFTALITASTEIGRPASIHRGHFMPPDVTVPLVIDANIAAGRCRAGYSVRVGAYACDDEVGNGMASGIGASGQSDQLTVL